MIIGGLLILLGAVVAGIAVLLGGSFLVAPLVLVGIPIVDGFIALIVGAVAALALFLV